MLIVLSTKDTVYVKALGNGVTELRYLTTGKTLLVNCVVTINVLEGLK